jgi:apolipoprotein D and lipocalin family protein
MNFSCSHKKKFNKTVEKVDIERFMGKWYVNAGRLTFMEEGAHNAIEIYTWNEKEDRIDIDFRLRKDSFEGEEKLIPQKAWIQNKKTNAHWKVSPFWPIKFNYYVIDLADDYSWTVIGVPGQEWVWIMSRDWTMEDEQLSSIITRIKNMGYNIKDINRVPQKW